MSTRVVDRVDEWEQRSFTGGYRELHTLADQEFSGVVRAGGAELYMTKGVVVGIRQGSIDDFQDGQGTIYDAPSEALPLLGIMQERNEAVRDKFYTEKTAISEVDKTLADGGFTGFVELSENVLSGDYYLVYHGGRSMSVGFVGESARLIDDDEAFETADDEVGIYKVRPVDIDRLEIPEPEEPASSGRGGGTSGSGSEPTGTQTGADADGVGSEPSGAGRTREDSTSAGTETSTSAGTEGQQATHQAQQDEQGVAETADAGRTAGTDVDEQPAETREAERQTGAGTERTRTQESRSEQTAQDTGTATQDTGRGQQESGRQEQSRSDQRETQADSTETRRDETQQRTDSTGTRADSTETRTDSTDARTDRTDTRANSTDTQASRTDTTRGSTRDQGQERQGRSDTQTAQGGSQPREQGQSRGSGGTADSGREPTGGGREWDTASVPSSGAAPAGSAEDLALEQRAIPSLDPTHTREPDRTGGGRPQEPTPDPATQPAEPPQQEPEPRQPRQQPPAEPSAGGQQQPDPPAGGQQPPAEPAETVDTERVDQLESEIEEKEAEIERLENELRAASAEADDLRDELASVREERDALEEEVERLDEQRQNLEAEIERLESELGASTDAERRITSEEALTGTDIFVRYFSKGQATLEKAHGGSTRKDEVHENLRLEKHTQFDADSVAVGGQSYAEYLESTVEYQFVEWLIRELLFEIRETGHDKKLKDLYDVLPAVDRAELAGVVEAVYTADGQETRSQEAFDIILRDRMGNPLLVANLNDSREAATEGMMEDLITSAERVGQTADEFAGAFLVTKSFFDPGALEVAEESTQGGLFSRDKRKSFVNLSRKNGYHLCLVEARNENFHLAVPEL